MKRLTYRQINAFLLHINALTEAPNANGKLQRYPTEHGRQLGITIETRNNVNGEYQVVLYNKDAQMFILDNIGAIISLEKK